jgi:hypothetical protein
VTVQQTSEPAASRMRVNARPISITDAEAAPAGPPGLMLRPRPEYLLAFFNLFLAFQATSGYKVSRKERSRPGRQTLPSHISGQRSRERQPPWDSFIPTITTCLSVMRM